MYLTMVNCGIQYFGDGHFYTQDISTHFNCTLQLLLFLLRIII